MKRINILMGTDENYISQAWIAIWSSRMHTNHSYYIAVTILCSERLGVASRKRVEKLSETLDNLSVRFVDVDERQISGAKDKEYVTVATYYMLLASTVFPDEDRCLFMDADLVVETDLSRLYEIDIDGFYAAGVREMVLMRMPNWATELKKKSNLPALSDYINTGIILWNLESMRQDHVEEKMIENINAHNEWMAQDIVHRVCHGKIKLIDYHYNFNPMFDDEIWQYHYPVKDSTVYGTITHFVGARKPWKNDKIPSADIWWKYAKIALEDNEYEKISASVEHIYSITKLWKVVDEFGKNAGYVIVGYSDNGIMIEEELKRNGVHCDIIFCDNDDKKIEAKLRDNVFSIQKAVAKYGDHVWINAVQNRREEITEQISSLGINRDKIIICSMERW